MRFISMLCVQFQKEGFVVKHSDCLIIKSAFKMKNGSKCVVVVGEGIEFW